MGAAANLHIRTVSAKELATLGAESFHGLSEAYENSQILLVEWHGDMQPKGLKIADTIVSWSQNNRLTANKRLIGIFDRLVENGGQANDLQKVLVFVPGFALPKRGRKPVALKRKAKGISRKHAIKTKEAAIRFAGELAQYRDGTSTKSRDFERNHVYAEPNERDVYQINEGLAATRLPSVRGGKGASLARLASLKMPVPPGFTLTINGARRLAEEGDEYVDWQFHKKLQLLEKQSGLGFGSKEAPLLVSVRSGAAASMPGMMDTVLNVGINEESIAGLAKRLDEKCAWRCYMRFISMFGSTVMGAPKSRFESALEAARQQAGVESDSQLPLPTVQTLCRVFRSIVLIECGRHVPTDPIEQLSMAVFAVINSWHSERAHAYRNVYSEGSGSTGTAVNVQAMVFGNAGATSGTGVVFSRNPATGANKLYGEYLPDAQGEDLVAGIRTPLPISKLARRRPEIYEDLTDMVARLEKSYRDIVDVEFTIENGKLYLLQCRPAKRTARAAAVFAVHQVEGGVWTKAHAVQTVSSEVAKQLMRPTFDATALKGIPNSRVLFRCLSASPGAAVGQVAFTKEKVSQLVSQGKKAILVRPDTSPDDLPGMLGAEAVATKVGGYTSHAAVVARGIGKPAVVGCKSEDGTCEEGAIVSVDGDSGTVISGALPMVQPKMSREIRIFLSWVKDKFLPRVDFAATSKEVSVNRVLNDFYFSQALVKAAENTQYATSASQLHESITINAGELFACYLIYAVATELAFANSQRLSSEARTSLKSLEKKFGNVSDDNEAFERIKKKDKIDDCVDYLSLATKVFASPGWSSGYGGKPWAKISAAARDFLSGKLVHTVFIDHVFDLRHNGGTLFDKHGMVSSKTSEPDIKDQLDAKKKAKSVRTLHEQLSSLHAPYDDNERAFDPRLERMFERGKRENLW